MRGKRAIVLISTMLLVVVLTIVLTAGIVLVPGGLGLAQNYHHKRTAWLAAQSGLEWAVMQLQKDTTWRGNGSPPDPSPSAARWTWPGSGPNLTVVEDRGNVIGFLRTPNGDVGQFRIRFNYQDGGPAADGFNNPMAQDFINHEFISVNNLAGAGQIDVPRANKGGAWAVPGSPSIPYRCPPNTVDLFVEGRAGWGLRDLDVTNPNASGIMGRGFATVVLEATYQRDLSKLADAALYSSMDVTGQLGNDGQFEVQSATSAAPKVRSNNAIILSSSNNNGNYVTSASGQVFTDKSGVNPAGLFTMDGSPENPSATAQTANFPKISWTSIKRAVSGGAFTGDMPAGTYIWRASRNLEYFPMTYDPTLPLPAEGTGTVVNNGTIATNSAIELDSTAFEIQVRKNVFVQSAVDSAGLPVHSVAVVPEPAVTASGNRPTVVFDNLDPTKPAPIMTVTDHDGNDSALGAIPGDVTLQGELTGEGAVTAEGKITFQGPSSFETTPTNGVAVYAKDDIILQAIPDPVVNLIQSTGNGKGKGKGKGNTPTPQSPEAQDVVINGVIFTQKSFLADLRTGVVNVGSLDLRGIVVAYGGDVDQNLAEGTYGAGVGRAEIKAEHAKFTYDPKYINQLQYSSIPLARKLLGTY